MFYKWMMSPDPIFLNMENGWLRSRNHLWVMEKAAQNQWIAVSCVMAPPCGEVEHCWQQTSNN